MVYLFKDLTGECERKRRALIGGPGVVVGFVFPFLGIALAFNKDIPNKGVDECSDLPGDYHRRQ